MEDNIHLPQVSKYSRVNSNGGKLDSSKIGLISNDVGAGGASLEDKTDVFHRAGPTNTEAITCPNTVNGGGGDLVASTRFGRQWQNSSRIIRVSRASGGKDRHSKVWTAKGPRDRRVRLSVNTAIQFYDLQDRLGYDQPSKAVEWLIKAASESINELPSLNSCNFPPETPRQVSDERRSGNNVVDSTDLELVQDHGQNNQQVGSLPMSISGCSSNNSETSKGSGLSLSRTEIRVKARERARERTAKENKGKESSEPFSRVTVAAHHLNNTASQQQTSSFTQLLTAGLNNLRESNVGLTSTPSPCQHGERERHNGDSTSTNNTLQWLSSSCTTQMSDFNWIQFNSPLPHVMTLLPFNGSTHEFQQHHHQQLPFLVDHHNHQHNNLNFSISSSPATSGLTAGFNRGTLQSNSPSFLPYIQRFSATDGGSSVPFFLGGAPIVENQHYHHEQLNPAGLQLSYGDNGAGRHSDHKGKGKN